MSSDPIRIMDDDRLSSELRADLRACAGPTTDYDMDAGLARLSAGLAAGAIAGTAAAHAGVASTVKATGLSFLAKVVAGVAVVGAVGGIVYVGSGSRSSAPATAPPATPNNVESSADAEVTTSSPSAVATAFVATPSMSARASSEAPAPETATADASSSTARLRPRSSLTSPISSASVSAESSIVKEEIAFMAELRAKAHSDAAAAAAMADEGQSRFPRGLFWQDRESIAVEALVQRGQQDEARRRARAFLARHPESPFAERMRRVTGLD